MIIPHGIKPCRPAKICLGRRPSATRIGADCVTASAIDTFLQKKRIGPVLIDADGVTQHYQEVRLCRIARIEIVDHDAEVAQCGGAICQNQFEHAQIVEMDMADGDCCLGYEGV